MKTYEIIGRFQDYKPYFRRYRIHILIIAAVFGILMGIYAKTSIISYTAVGTFNPELPSAEGGVSAVSVLMGGGASEGGNTEVLGVMLSRSLSYAVAADSANYKGERILMADKILEKNPLPLSVKIKKLFSKKKGEMSLKSKMQSAGSILRIRMDLEADKLGFMEMTFEYPDKKLVELICKKYLRELDAYFQIQKTEKAKQNVTFFSARTDSVERELKKMNYALAKYQDENKFRILQQDAVAEREMQAKLQSLQQMYKALVEAREQAVGQLQRETPIIQVLDPPVPPYRNNKKSVTTWVIIGIILGAFLGGVWFTRRLIMEDAWEFIRNSIDREEE